jgi:hypothetical protein
MFTLIEHHRLDSPRHHVHRRSDEMERSDRTLIIIGGHEDRSNNLEIRSQGDRFDFINRVPSQMEGRAAEKLPEKEEEPQPA